MTAQAASVKATPAEIDYLAMGSRQEHHVDERVAGGSKFGVVVVFRSSRSGSRAGALTDTGTGSELDACHAPNALDVPSLDRSLDRLLSSQLSI